MSASRTVQGGGVRVAVGRWVRMEGGCHTSHGDCELISTLEREREREGRREGWREGKVRKKESGKAGR